MSQTNTTVGSGVITSFSHNLMNKCQTILWRAWLITQQSIWPAAFSYPSLAGTRCGGNVATAGRHPAASPCWGRGLGCGAQPGVGTTSGLRGQPAASGHDETDDGDGAGEEGADANDGAAETAALQRAETTATAATTGRAGEPSLNQCASWQNGSAMVARWNKTARPVWFLCHALNSDCVFFIYSCIMSVCLKL